MNNLYKISLIASIWYRGNKPKPIYVIAKDKESAQGYLERHLDREISIKSILLLGEERSATMFSANKG